MKRHMFFLAGMACTFFSACSHAQDEFRIASIFHMQSPGGWDYLTVGPGNGRLYVSHSTQVNILDKSTGDSIGVIANTAGIHGIAFDTEQQKGFTSNGRANTVTVFDLKTNKPITDIPVGENPDAIMYEPFIKKIITCNGRSQDLSIIDPVENKVVGTIPVGGKPETAASDEKGKLFVNIEDKSEIAVIDLAGMNVMERWPLAPAEEPTGLAIDRNTHRLFAGCGNSLRAIINTNDGMLVKTLPIGRGCDGVAFDPGSHEIFTSNGEGTMSVYREKGADDYEKVGTVTTKRGARTIFLDPQTHWIYLPTAEFEASAPQGQRPAMIPGSFQVLVIHR